MAPITPDDLLGVHQVHVDGGHWFNVRCTRIPGVSLTEKLSYNTCSAPLEFEFLPKPGDAKLPSWVSSTRPVKKTSINRWGKPYNCFTCEVDGDAYCAFKTKKDLVDWRMTNDFEEICLWKRGGKTDQDNAAQNVWKKLSGKWKWVARHTGDAKSNTGGGSSAGKMKMAVKKMAMKKK
ncbi:unnamed protein product [Amoebophrya sp. A120]|nr:unnamed protein product [Amoebophrya sp. A120]|eukprot:GSA120T00013027001.1